MLLPSLRPDVPAPTSDPITSDFIKGPAWAVSVAVSVVLISYNQERFVGPAVESVLAQTLAGWELLCVDDGSADGTRDVLAAYAARDPRIRTLSHPNQGLSYTRNAGLHAADLAGRAVLFLDGDDTLSPHALETLLFHLAREPDAAAVVARAEHIGPDGLPCEGRFPFPEPREGRKELSEMIERPWGMGMYPASIALYARWAAEAAGGYNASMRACEDDDFALRVALHGPFVFIPDVLTQYRRHEGNVTNRQEFVERAYRQAIRRRPWYRRAWNAGRGAALGRPIAPEDRIIV